MTEKQKKIALVIGVVVIGVVLLLWPRKATGTTIVNQQGMAPIEVSIPSLNIPVRGPIAINIPGLPSMSPYAFNAISPCMCNGLDAAYTDSSYNGPLVEFVTNEGDSGPNIYNYNYSQPDTGFTASFVAYK